MNDERVRGSNPTLNEGVFDRVSEDRAGPRFQARAVVWKTAVLLLLSVVAGAAGWVTFAENPALLFPAVIASAIGGLVMCITNWFKPELAKFTSPVYAVLQGVVIGGISMILNARYPGIAIQAGLLTAAVFGVMLGSYRVGLIRATEKFKAVVIGATLGILLTYLLNMGLRLFGMNGVPMIHEAGVWGIGFSLFVCAIAALNLILDFDFIDEMQNRDASAKLEWYAAFGLLVTLLWLYVEILRLLSKLRR